jgi:uncharacterized protein YhfF
MDMQEPTFSIRALESRLAQRGIVVPSGALPFMFGNTPELARKLSSLVAKGQKTATAGVLWEWEADDGGPPKESQVYIVHDWKGMPIAVTENTQVSIVPFNRVDAQFAREEGNLSLAWWCRAHWHYFSAECRRLGRETFGGYAGRMPTFSDLVSSSDLTQHWSRPPTASARASLSLLAAATASVSRQPRYKGTHPYPY